MPARGSLASRNQSIGIKVLDIKDQPLSLKDARKRKKDEEDKEKKVSGFVVVRFRTPKEKNRHLITLTGGVSR